MGKPSGLAGRLVYDERLALSLTLLLLLRRGCPAVNSPSPARQSTPAFPPMTRFHFSQRSLDNPQSQSQSQSKKPAASESTTRQDSSKLELNPYVSGEFAKAIKPSRQRRLHLMWGKPCRGGSIAPLLPRRVNTGDNCKSPSSIWRSSNRRRCERWVGRGKDIGAITPNRNRGAVIPDADKHESGSWPAGDAARHGRTIFLDFNKSLPTDSDELKQLFSPFLNLPRERSAGGLQCSNTAANEKLQTKRVVGWTWSSWHRHRTTKSASAIKARYRRLDLRPAPKTVLSASRVRRHPASNSFA